MNENHIEYIRLIEKLEFEKRIESLILDISSESETTVINGNTMTTNTRSEERARSQLVSDKVDLIRTTRKLFKSGIECSMLTEDELKNEYQYYLLSGDNATIKALELKTIAKSLDEPITVKTDIDPNTEIDACFKFCDEIQTLIPTQKHDTILLTRLIRRVNYWYIRLNRFQVDSTTESGTVNPIKMRSYDAIYLLSDFFRDLITIQDRITRDILASHNSTMLDENLNITSENHTLPPSPQRPTQNQATNSNAPATGQRDPNLNQSGTPPTGNATLPNPQYTYERQNGISPNRSLPNVNERCNYDTNTRRNPNATTSGNAQWSNQSFASSNYGPNPLHSRPYTTAPFQSTAPYTA